MNARPLNLRRASTAGIFASLASGLATFIVFRFSIEIVSLAAVGSWALIQGMFLIARISDIGTGANITRAVAQPIKEGERPQIGRIVAAGLILSTLPVAAIGALLTPIIIWYVSKQYGSILQTESINALCLLALLGGVLSSVAAVTMAALEGTFKIVFKSWTTVGANLVGLGATLPLLGIMGIPALGVLSVVVPLIQVTLCGTYLWRTSVGHSPTTEISLTRMLQSLWKENIRLSAIGLCRLSFEPASKILLSLIAPLQFIAIFELALRVATQMRVTIQAAAQPLLVVGVRSNDKFSDASARLFGDAQVRMSLVATSAAGVALVGSPLISWLGLGFFDMTFLVIFAILMISNTINTCGLVGYYYLVSGARLNYLLVVHVLMMGLIAVGGMIALVLRSPITVVLSYGAAFCLGGIMSLTPLKTAVPFKLWNLQATGVGVSSIFIATACLAITLTAQILLLPSAETSLLIGVTVMSSLLMTALAARPLIRAVGRTKEV